MHLQRRRLLGLPENRASRHKVGKSVRRHCRGSREIQSISRVTLEAFAFQNVFKEIAIRVSVEILPLLVCFCLFV